MTDLPASCRHVIDPDTLDALHEILADPSTPFGVAPGAPYDRQLTALREAHDYISSRRVAAAAIASPQAARAVLDGLGEADPQLARTLRRHVVLAPILAELPAGRERDAVLGDIDRGDLVTWTVQVNSWTWHEGAGPSGERPIARADAELIVDHFPGLYDAILLWEPTTAAVIAVPTHRAGVSWVAAEANSIDRWVVRLDRTTFHTHELIRIGSDQRALLDRLTGSTSPAPAEP
ncbi:hypothetical protein B7C42_00030 [Nocardia cerradoensis]|uniref:Uncharacterized protein n=1 Tax=Nocardia cerradoensis TaxID=85688 RepID=A0A231HDR1_9NOCA|nr:hypothetical protein [Nocardia cerradoensis]OXR46916.1 hypothetical protein B7C42_00030 [Nocardia cerradoensis]